MNTDIIVLNPDQQTSAANALAPIPEHPAVKRYLTNLKSDNSKTAMRKHLNKITEILTNGLETNAHRFHWETLSAQETGELRATLMEHKKADGTKYATATVNVMLAALRGVLKACYDLEFMDADAYHRARGVETLKDEKLPTGRDLKADEISALVNVCNRDKSPIGIRDRALIAILKNCGLRRAEAAALQLTDFDAETGKVTVKRGKGDKPRTVYIYNGALAAVLSWIAIRGDSTGALFNPTTKARWKPTETVQFDTSTGLTAVAIYKMLEKRARQAGVKSFSPHDFRRTYAGDLLDKGIDISTVAKTMGHASVETTSRYDRRGEETKQDAARKLDFPT